MHSEVILRTDTMRSVILRADTMRSVG